MSPREFRESAYSETQKLRKRTQTSVANFHQIAVFGGHVSSKLVKRLSNTSKAAGGYTSLDDIFFPSNKLIQAARENSRKVREKAKLRAEENK